MENIADVAARFAEPEDGFPNLMADLHSSRKSRVAKYFPQISEFLLQGSIPNAQLSDIRRHMTDVVKDGFSAMVKSPYLLNRPDESNEEEFKYFEDNLKKPFEAIYWDLNLDLHLIKSAQKRYDKILKEYPILLEHPVNSAVQTFFEEAQVLSDAGQFLKENAVKRQMLTDAEKEAKAKYVPPMADKAAQELIYGVLNEISQSSFQSLKAAFTIHAQGSFESALAKSKANPELKISSKEFTFDEKHALMHHATLFKRGEPYAPRPNMEAALADIEASCERDARTMTEQFVIKNLRKLASIVDRKSEVATLESVVEIGRRLDVATLEGEMRFKFSDGSEFDIKNQAVRVINSFNTRFMRYPLTFHNIIPASPEARAEMTKDRPLKGRSEEWMNKMF